MSIPAIHHRQLSHLLVAGVLCALSIAAQATEPARNQGGKKYVAPKTEFGHPDLRGVWNFSSDTPL